jgi:hypothetical protein
VNRCNSTHRTAEKILRCEKDENHDGLHFARGAVSLFLWLDTQNDEDLDRVETWLERCAEVEE